jgi:hypothetical protein
LPWLIADLKSIPQKAGKIMGVSLLQDLEELSLGRKQFGFFEDFETFVTGDLFTDTSADSGATIAVGDAAGGVNVLTTGATDNNEAYLLTTKELFKFAANKPLLFEARIQYAEANTDDANVCLGFMDAVGANSILDDGAGPKASYSGAVFFKVDGGTRWQAESSLAGSQTTTDLTAANSLSKSAQTAGGASYQTLRIEVIPVSSTEAEVSFWIDGVHVMKHSLTYTSATEMMAFVGVKAGGANSEVVNVDYIAAYQDR